MAVISLTIGAAAYTRVVTAVCNRNAYQSTIDGVPNPNTPQAFFKQWLIAKALDETRAYESEIAAATASANAGLDVNNTVIIT